MTAKKYAIVDAAAAAAKKYGKTVSQGILKMESIITDKPDEKIVHPGSKVTINPVIINDTYRQKEEQHEL